MSSSNTLAASQHVLNSLHFFDHYHIIKFFNERLSDFRRELQREAEGPLGKEVLKWTQWLILINPENLREEKGESEGREKHRV